MRTRLILTRKTLFCMLIAFHETTHYNIYICTVISISQTTESSAVINLHLLEVYIPDCRQVSAMSDNRYIWSQCDTPKRFIPLYYILIPQSSHSLFMQYSSQTIQKRIKIPSPLIQISPYLCKLLCKRRLSHFRFTDNTQEENLVQNYHIVINIISLQVINIIKTFLEQMS